MATHDIKQGELPFLSAIISEFQKMDYGFYESKITRIKLDIRPTSSYIVLAENNLISIRCDFQYFIDWLKRKNTNRLQVAIIHTFFAKTFSLRLSQSPNHLQRLLFSNIDLKGFKNFAFGYYAPKFTTYFTR